MWAPEKLSKMKVGPACASVALPSSQGRLWNETSRWIGTVLPSRPLQISATRSIAARRCAPSDPGA